MFSLSNEPVLIVGGLGALGKNLRPKLEALSAPVVIGDTSSADEETEGASPRRCYFLDATQPGSIESFRAKIEKDGLHLSHIVNVVGGLRESGLTDIFKTSAKEITDTVELNLLSQLYVVRFLGEHLAQKAGADKSITMISSVNAFAGFSIPFYSAAKGGLHGLLKPLAMDLGRYGIRVNIVSPGTIQTPSTERQPKKFEDRAASAALGRLCTPDDVSTAIISCILMRGMTGQNLAIDAGQTAGASSSLYEQERNDTGLKRRLQAFSLPAMPTPGSGKS